MAWCEACGTVDARVGCDHYRLRPMSPTVNELVDQISGLKAALHRIADPDENHSIRARAIAQDALNRG